MDSSPWLIVGVFNTILSADEHSTEGYVISIAERDFLDCIRLIEVEIAHIVVQCSHGQTGR